MKSRAYIGYVAIAAAAALAAPPAAAQPPRATVTGAPTRTPAPREPDTRPAAQPPESIDAEYRLAAGDKLRIEVYKDPQLSQSVQVRPDGRITMPLIGDIEAAGQTPLGLRDGITTALKEYVNNPVVTVIVVEAMPPTAFVVGEVNNPGAIALQNPMTVLQALAVAGGLRDFANSKNIRILRQNAGRVQTIDFNYKDAMRGDASPVYLRPGDTVVVP